MEGQVARSGQNQESEPGVALVVRPSGLIHLVFLLDGILLAALTVPVALVMTDAARFWAVWASMGLWVWSFARSWRVRVEVFAFRHVRKAIGRR